jgi:hypothetical protein
MWVASAVDHQVESVNKMYDYLLSWLKRETSHPGNWLENSLTQDNTVDLHIVGESFNTCDDEQGEICSLDPG